MERYLGLHTGMLYDYFKQKRSEELINCIPSHYKTKEPHFSNIKPVTHEDQ